MSQAVPPVDAGRIVRPRLIWRLLFWKVLLLGAFLYLCLLGLGAYLLMLGFDGGHPQAQRLMALGGGGGILLLSLWLLKVAMPRRFGPALIEPDR